MLKSLKKGKARTLSAHSSSLEIEIKGILSSLIELRQARLEALGLRPANRITGAEDFEMAVKSASEFTRGIEGVRRLDLIEMFQSDLMNLVIWNLLEGEEERLEWLGKKLAVSLVRP